MSLIAEPIRKQVFERGELVVMAWMFRRPTGVISLCRHCERDIAFDRVTKSWRHLDGTAACKGAAA